MPAKGLEALAQKFGVSIERAERIWDESKESCKKQYGYKEGSTELYRCAMGITRKRLEAKKDSRFDLVRQLDVYNLSKVYVEDIHPDISGIQVYLDGTSVIYIVPEELYRIMESMAFGEKISAKLLDLLERKSKKKVIVKEKKPKVRKIADTFSWRF